MALVLNNPQMLITIKQSNQPNLSIYQSQSVQIYLIIPVLSFYKDWLRIK